MTDDFSYEFISENDVEFVSRGRKSQTPQELVTALRKLTKGQALKLSSFAVDPKGATAKTDKARYSAVIRQAGKQAGVKVTIKWSPAGVPQVIVTGKVTAK